MSTKRHKLKAPAGLPSKRGGEVYDRLADINVSGDIGIVELPDPFAVSENAEQNSKGEWVVPAKDRIRAIKSFKNDPIGRMFARRQIGEAEEEACRRFQRLHDDAQLGVIRGIDPAKPKVDGGTFSDPLTDTQQAAMLRIRQVEAKIVKKHGADGLIVINGVLVEKLTIEAVANRVEYKGKSEFWRGLFQQCLRTLGKEMGTLRDEAA